MKVFKLIIITLCTPVVFMSCQKDNKGMKDVPVSTNKPAPAAQNPVHGFWVGESVLVNKSIPAYFSFIIKENGKLDVLNAMQQVTGQGTWQLNGDSLQVTYVIFSTGNTYSCVAYFDDAAKKLNGTWGFNGSIDGGGYWKMEKMN